MLFSLHRLSSCPYRERPLHFSLNVFMQIQRAIHPPSTQFTKLLPFESPLLPSKITQFELSILVLHMAVAAFLWAEPRELLYLFYRCHTSDVVLSLSADLVWFGSSAIFQLHILHRPLCPCLFHYSNHILITFPLSQMANNSIKPQFSLWVRIPPWMDRLPSSRIGLMRIILQQICSGTSGRLAEMRVTQQRSFELMPHNERCF